MSTYTSPVKTMDDMMKVPSITPDAVDQSVKSRSDQVSQYTSEHVETTDGNLYYENDEEEPELHARTYLAVFSVIVFTIAGLLALQGPPAVLTYIAQDLNNTASQTWIQNALVVPQSVFAPVVASIADTFQLRKSLIVGFCLISFVGAAIAPGSSSIYRLIAAQTLVGFGFVVIPLAQVIPSEILPRKWRPMAQALINAGGGLGAISGPLIIGALTRSNPSGGWRTFFWIEMGLWGVAAIGMFFGYRPPKRHTRYDHLSFTQKVKRLDLLGSALLTVGLTLFLVGANLGDSLYSWTHVKVLTTLIIGIVFLVIFSIYEWKGTQTGILHHELFQRGAEHGRTVAICLGLMAAEGALMFAYIIYYPILTSAVFETDPLLIVVRSLPFWGFSCASSIGWGYVSTKLRMIREVLFVGFVIFTGGIVGIATVQPSDSVNLIIFASLAGIGFGAPVILLMAAVQLAPPHHLIATASALNVSARAIGATIFTAIYTANLQTRLDTKLPAYIAAAVLPAGLPASSLPAFIGALSTHDATALSNIPGVTPSIIELGNAALKQAFTDSIRVVYIVAAVVGAVACIGCLFMGNLRKTMGYRVDAPLEELQVKRARHRSE
ncbi:uncharacterized protein Z520_11281 [Fonsecaea multimorphosa CBS 102226]|uniref:Major facilitator superfamily (MFS) profile domain-containing protein n=1 Tax=Fonsecaea multimorphosa CBS 102226 TaxID=1442371 RepID=A0A0D2K9D9_9EURO|nr:uncharacterized protein Z520_11281 [Fonsecaea multimorphosa CBS 102226]KIX93008.1 hypothetical protein Z520_11281 [Fonsecaea multimorphosa CBS 102226]OAL18257.1 hypothetical protein AYO22_10835 [Fonsecaea multimorphosa]